MTNQDSTMSHSTAGILASCRAFVAEHARGIQHEMGDAVILIDEAAARMEHLERALTASNDLVGEMERQREQLRVLLLEQPTTDERDTYSDGFANGLAHAINCIDGAIRDARNGGGGR